MPTKEEKVAKQKLANAKAKVRTMMLAGRTAAAEAYAAEQGFDVFAARLGPEYQSPAEPAFAALEAERAKPLQTSTETIKALEAEFVAKHGPLKPVHLNFPTPGETAPAVMDMDDDAPAAPTEINGWPVLTDAVVWGIPPNKSLVVIELPDKRRVSMWRTRRASYSIYMKLRARLVKTEGDPIYEEVMPERGAF
jgi:hypothetical protein